MQFEDIIKSIERSQRRGSMTTRIIAVDGPGGAGKSTFANRLSDALNGAPIIHTDDFASWDNPLNWWPRLIEQVLEPLARNVPARYQRYDWDTKSLAEWHDVEPTDYIIVEGVSSSREAFRPYVAYSVWIETPRDERLRRGLERDGESARAQWDEWMAREDEYIQQEKPAERADVVIDGTADLNEK